MCSILSDESFLNMERLSLPVICPAQLRPINRRADYGPEPGEPMTRGRLIAAASVLVVATTGYIFVLFDTLALANANPRLIGQLDLHVARLFFDLRSARLIDFFTVVTAFGNWGIVFLLAASASVVLWLTRRLRYIPELWFVLIGNQTLIALLKGLFLRPRPEYAVYREVTASFPSGHSAASFALFGFLTYVLVRERTGPKVLVLVGGLVIVILVGLSRLILGEHYFSDVLSGYLVGAVWVVLGICLTELRSGTVARTGVTEPRRMLAVFAVILLTGIALCFTVKTYIGSLQSADTDSAEQLSVG